MANKLAKYIADAEIKLVQKAGKKLFNILPKKEVLERVEKAAPEFFDPARKGGATFDPRTQQFLTVGKDQGFAVSPIENPVNNSNVVPMSTLDQQIQDLLDVVRTPEVMRELQTGANLGSWLDSKKNGLVVDPSVLRPTLEDAMGIARKAKQDAIFDVGTGTEIATTPERVLGRGTVFGGTPQEKMNFVEYLMSRATGPKKAVLNPEGRFTNVLLGGKNPILSQARETNPNQATSEMAKYLSDTESPIFGDTNAAMVQQKLPRLQSALGKTSLVRLSPTGSDLENVFGDFIENEVGSDTIKSALQSKVSAKSLSMDKKYSTLNQLSNTKVAPVRHIDPSKPDASLINLLQEGKTKEYFESLSDMVKNLLAHTPKEFINYAKDNSGNPLFYQGRSSLNDLVSSITGLPKHITSTLQSINSASAGPAIELTRTLALLPHMKMDSTGKVIFDRESAIKNLGPKALEGPGIKNAIKSIEDIFNNPDWLNQNISGIAEKTHPYNILNMDPKNPFATVEDTIQSGARVGIKTNMPKSFDQSIHGQLATRIAAEIVGINPSAFQEIPWFVNRLMGGKSASSIGSYPWSQVNLENMLLGTTQIPAHSGARASLEGISQSSKLLQDAMGGRKQLVDPDVVAATNEIKDNFIASLGGNNAYDISTGQLIPSNEIGNIIDYANRTPENIKRLQLIQDALKNLK